MSYKNFFEKEFQVNFPSSVNEKIDLSLQSKKTIVFSFFNFQEFALIGSQLIQEGNYSQDLKELKALREEYPVLKEYVPIAYNTLSYFPSVVCLKNINGTCGEELFYFRGLELNTTYFVETGQLFFEIVTGKQIPDDNENYIRYNSNKASFESYLEDYFLVSGYGEDLANVISQLNSLLKEEDAKFVDKGRQIYRNNKLIFEYPYREDEFIPDEFFKLIEKDFPEYCWFQVFINWDLEHWGFGKISTTSSKENLKKKGYRKFDYTEGQT